MRRPGVPSAGLTKLSCWFTLLLLFLINLELVHLQSSYADQIAKQALAKQSINLPSVAKAAQPEQANAIAPIITPLLVALGGTPKVVAGSLASSQQQQQQRPASEIATSQQAKLNETSAVNSPDHQLTASSAKIHPAVASSPLLLQQGNINLDEPIIQLDYSNINDEILNKNTANLVYFNANFNRCRNCDRFFATWKELALDIRWWRNIVRLYVINCSDDDNIEACRRAGATEFPQLRFYWVRSNSLSQDGQRLRILGKSVHAMRHLITDKLVDGYLEHNRLVAQRSQSQVAAGTTNSNPISALTSFLAPSLGGGSATSGATNHLTALVPLVGQLLGNANSNSSSPIGLVTSIMGKGQTAVGKASGAPQSLANFMNGISSMQGITQMVNTLMGLASWRRSLSLQPLPNNWPELEPIETTNTQSLLSLLPTRAGSLLVMETQEFLYTGLEVMLDLNPYSNQTYIARVRDDRSQLTKNLTQRDDIQAPALIHVSERREIRLIMTAPKYSNDEDLRRAFVKAFDKRQSRHLKRVWSSGQLSGQQAFQAVGGSKTQEDEEIISRMNNVYMSDLLNTIRASLMDQVFRHSDLSDDQYNALVKYVYALINYFPFQNNDHLKFFKRLHAWLQNQVSPLDMAEYKKQFYDIDDVLGTRPEWIACKSLSNINAILEGGKRFSVGSLLFENPSQLGKMVSNITRLFRSNQQKVAQLKSLVGVFTSTNSSPVVLTNNNNQQLHPIDRELPSQTKPRTVATTTTTTVSPHNKQQQAGDNDQKKNDTSSSIEQLMNSVTSGSLGSDSSILKLISSALTGGDDSPNSRSRKRVKSKYAREYSCGAWKLAHVMVVSEYNKDSPRSDVKHIVLHSLYQYMVHFYSCSTCGNRVSDISSEFKLQLDDHLHDQADSIMLLWKLHNRVNKRLEAESRPGSPPKVQFPPESLCFRCRTVVKARQDEPNGSNPSWTERFVLPFLIQHYSSSNIIMGQGDKSSSSSSSGSTSALIVERPFGGWLSWTTVIVSCFITMSVVIM